MECQNYSLFNGKIWSSWFNLTLEYPLILSTCQYHEPLFNDPQKVRDPFANGFVIICYVVSAVAVAAWCLVLLLVLSTTPKLRRASLLAVFYAVMVLVVLTKTTDLLDLQFLDDFQDATEFRMTVLRHRITFAFKIVVLLLTICSWSEIAEMVFVRYKRSVRSVSGVLFVATVIFNCLFFTILETNPSRFALYILCVITEFSVFVLFQAVVVYLLVSKRKVAFGKHAFALLCFSLVMLVCPFVFYMVYVVSDKIDNWTTILADFMPVLVTVVVWELLYKIGRLEKANEMKTILGRQILDDEVPEGTRGRMGMQLHELTEIRLGTPVNGS